jgi:hypothetical protein
MKTISTTEPHFTNDAVSSGVFAGGDEIPPGTFHGGDEIPPGTFHGKNEISQESDRSR